MDGDRNREMDKARGRGPHIIAVGNQKGGTGKTTTAVHVAIALLYAGFAVAAIDLDSPQATLSRYLENRLAFAEAEGTSLPAPRRARPEVRRFGPELATDEDRQAFADALAGFGDCDFIVLDLPGGLSVASQLGHEAADTLITPVNDSYLDLDVLARIDRSRRQVLAPGAYSQFVWEAHNRRVLDGREPADWIVMRNRLTHIDAHNKRDIGRLMEVLGHRLGFRTAPGFGERMVYRELFATGRTLLDLAEGSMTPSQRAALGEVVTLLETIGFVDAKAPA